MPFFFYLNRVINDFSIDIVYFVDIDPLLLTKNNSVGIFINAGILIGTLQVNTFTKRCVFVYIHAHICMYICVYIQAYVCGYDSMYMCASKLVCSIEN